MAARGACAAGRADAAHRGAPGQHRTRPSRRCGVSAGAAATGLERGPQPADRLSLGPGQCRRYPQIRAGAGRARARRPPGLGRLVAHAVITGDAHLADRVYQRHRSGRRRLRREHVAAGWQRHRLYSVRVQPERQMAGAAQASRAGRDPRRRPARPGSNLPASASSP